MIESIQNWWNSLDGSVQQLILLYSYVTILYVIVNIRIDLMKK